MSSVDCRQVNRWRRRGVKTMRHVTDSARPSIDLDTLSLAESIQLQALQRRGSRRGSRRRYGRANPSLDLGKDESDVTSNPLSFEDLELIVTRPEVIEDEFIVSLQYLLLLKCTIMFTT